jgi:hypothetical protein
VSPERFAKLKICFARALFGFAPLFTAGLFIVGEGLHPGDSKRGRLTCGLTGGLALG